MKELKTCTHVHDNGHYCQSAAVAGREYCVYHLRHRGRLMRMAQYRARSERFDLHLPPLENMHAVQSALSQVIEALAADMIDLKRARVMFTFLRQAADNFKHPEAWQPSAYASDQSQPHAESYDNFEAEYGLPENLDLNTPPEVAFPETPTDNWQQTTDNFRDLSPMPTAGYCSEHGYDCPDLVIRADHPVTPEMVEVREVADALGPDAAARRGSQLQRNRQLRQLRSNRKRFAEQALQHNIRIAAEKLAEQKLAAGKTATSQEVGSPIPPSICGVETFPDTSKRPPVPAGAPESAQMEAQKTA